MKGKRTTIVTKAKIFEEKINTNAQGSDIADKLGVPERTVNHLLNTEFAEVCRESSAVANLIDRNNKLQSLGDALIEQMIVEGEAKIAVKELVLLRNSTFQQNQLLTGQSTENSKIEIIIKE